MSSFSRPCWVNAVANQAREHVNILEYTKYLLAYTELRNQGATNAGVNDTDVDTYHYSTCGGRCHINVGPLRLAPIIIYHRYLVPGHLLWLSPLHIRVHGRGEPLLPSPLTKSCPLWSLTFKIHHVSFNACIYFSLIPRPLYFAGVGLVYTVRACA